MRRLSLLSALVSVLFVAVVASVQAQPTYNFSPLDRLLADSVDAISGLGGGYGMILVHNGEIVYEKTFGNFELDRVIPIASASKWLSGAVMMSLVDDGRLSLDDTLGRWWPDAPDDRRGMTIRQMFSHTAGWTDSEYHSDRTITMAEAADSIVYRLPLVRPVGTAFTYGGASMHVAGRIAEIVTDSSWHNLFAARVTEPLGMDRTFFGPIGTENPQVAGSGRSTAREYLRFLQMIERGGTTEEGERVLSVDVIRTMLADQTAGVPIVSSPVTRYTYIDAGLAEGRYGIGVWREMMESDATGRPDFTSPGAFGFAGWIDRERNLIGVFAVLSDLPRTAPTFFEAKRLIRLAVDGTTSVGFSTEGGESLDLW